VADIVLSGLRQNNLDDVSLRLPKERLIVFTGVSGSGKSSVVFDTIAAESQRQLNETFSSFLRNRLPKSERPRAERLAGLTVAVVVDQRRVGGNARSTVGTMTDVHGLLRLLFSRYGQPSAGPATAYSFNDPQGMCPECEGRGHTLQLDEDELLDRRLSLNEGAITIYPVGSYMWRYYAQSGVFDPDRPLAELSDDELHRLRRGGQGLTAGHGKFEGLLDRFERLYCRRDATSLNDKVRAVVTERPCPSCRGARLNERARASRIDGRNIADHAGMEVTDLLDTLRRLDNPVAAAAADALTRIEAIGLGYLSLDRETRTLSGGEAQRLKTVRHLGSSLTGVTYIFDEPSVGLHPRDVHQLGRLLVELRDKGNTVIVVEHNRDIIELADQIVDMGPGAGAEGGRVVYQGPLDGLGDTPTGRALRQGMTLKPPASVREPHGWLEIEHATLHNLRDLHVRLPLGVLTVVTGVAGSGKSTLTTHVLPAQHPATVLVDQRPISTSLRSTPATYLGVLDRLRAMFARANGVEAKLFSYNSEGACPACGGRGVIRLDLGFMEPVTTECETCRGTRYRPEALRYTVAGRTIADVLAMTADEARAAYDLPGLRDLPELGLGYLTLGQPLTTLSGGELQRLKLARRLRETGNVYVFDEPTTGLHMVDVRRLLELLDRLVDQGNTVIVVEHDLDVVAHADWVVDLGPEAGRGGGTIVFEGTPEDLTDAATHTGKHLAAAVR
jgi:excinuclease UvrABC ATPase subunit